MDEAQIEKLTDSFLSALRADPDEMTNFLLWCFVERLRVRALADMPEHIQQQKAERIVKQAIMETLRERGCDREEVMTVLRVSDAWMNLYGWHKPQRERVLFGLPDPIDLPSYA